MYGKVFEALALELKEKTGLMVEIEPEVASPSEPHLRIKPKSPTLKRDFMELNFELWFIAQGSGLAMLDKVMDLSVKLTQILRHFNISLGNAGFGVIFEKLSEGEFFINEDEGSKPYVWIEKWKGKVLVKRDV